VKLTGREAMVLEVLLRSGGQVVPKQTLLRQVWGMDFDGDPNIVDVYVSYLRRKIDHAYDQQLLHTVRGIGYRHSGQSPLPFKFLENGPLDYPDHAQRGMVKISLGDHARRIL
jgi:DNA-binding winged helix-turn-helix (wHTH) protein